jgi:hypothetical protein
MPLHFITTLSMNQIPNSVIYSDLPEQLSSSVSSIDILSNVTDPIKQFDPAAYTSYLDQQSPTHANTYREHAHFQVTSLLIQRREINEDGYSTSINSSLCWLMPRGARLI